MLFSLASQPSKQTRSGAAIATAVLEIKTVNIRIGSGSSVEAEFRRRNIDDFRASVQEFTSQDKELIVTVTSIVMNAAELSDRRSVIAKTSAATAATGTKLLKL